MKKRIIFSFLLTLLFSALLIAQAPTELADAQLEAYNNRDIDAFLAPYADSVKVYNGQRELLYMGKETMRGRYASLFERTPDLNCNLLNRIAVNNTIIEHEEVTFNGKTIYAIVMYKVADNKIQEVHFVN